VRHNLEVMGGKDLRLVALGGGTQGGLWTQLVSDVTGRPQTVAVETIGAALGDAMLAASAAGVDVTGWNHPDYVVHPSGSSGYEDFYRKYRELYPATRTWHTSLAERQLAADGENRGQGS
jgi:xylulokinase